MGWHSKSMREKLAAAVGGLAVASILATGCSSEETGKANSTAASSTDNSTVTSSTSAPSGTSTTVEEMNQMVQTALAGGSPIVCDAEDGSETASFWVRSDTQYKMVVTLDETTVGIVREDSMVRIWNEDRSEGMIITSADSDLSELDFNEILGDQLSSGGSNESVKCSEDSQETMYAAPASIKFYTIADVEAGDISEADAMALLDSIGAVGN